MAKASEKQTRFMSIKEVAEDFGMSRNFVWEKVKDGTFPSHKIGWRYYIPRNWVDKLAGE